MRRLESRPPKVRPVRARPIETRSELIRVSFPPLLSRNLDVQGREAPHHGHGRRRYRWTRARRGPGQSALRSRCSRRLKLTGRTPPPSLLSVTRTLSVNRLCSRSRRRKYCSSISGSIKCKSHRPACLSPVALADDVPSLSVLQRSLPGGQHGSAQNCIRGQPRPVRRYSRRVSLGLLSLLAQLSADSLPRRVLTEGRRRLSSCSSFETTSDPPP